uniref:Uncharacterized protein n=1 Tax=Anopheles coluzzii TaxID=1518534 RepID=A0A8W7PHF3_ANOCL
MAAPVKRPTTGSSAGSHRYDPTVLMHRPWHRCSVAIDRWLAHSSTSTHVFQSSSSMYPSGQTQNARPSVLRQVCEQPPLLTVHSSMSSQEWPSGASRVPGSPSQVHL